MNGIDPSHKRAEQASGGEDAAGGPGGASAPSEASAPGEAERALTVGAEAAGLRLDQFLAGALAEFSRSRLKQLILAGAVQVGGVVATEPKRPVAAGEAVAVAPPPAAPAEPQGEAIPLHILFEDDHIVVIDKPAGLVVHPAAGNWTGTLVNALIAHCGNSLSGIGGVRRPGIVHRLDKDTTGVMVVAKSDRAHAGLAAQFADHGRTGPLQRAYKAVAWGVPEPGRGTVDAPLGRSPRNRQRMAIVSSGRHALTHYAVEQRYGSAATPVASLVECRLETGRTHQIRVHLASIGHPLVADAEYGAGFRTKLALLSPAARDAAQKLGRQALHAWLLELEHPVSGKYLCFQAAMPADMQSLLDALAEM